MNAEILIGLAVFVLFSFVCRELACWYWKQNAILAELISIRTELRLTREQSEKRDGVRV